MNQLTLNAIALSVFAMTLSILVGPYVAISPALSAGLCLAILSLVTVDAARFQSKGLTLILDTLAQRSPRYRQRVLHHEAGHFLAASLLNLPIESYTLSTWEAHRKGCAAGVVLQCPPDAQPLNWTKANIESLCTVWVAGGVAERLKFGTTEGDTDDLRQLRQTLQQLGLEIRRYEQQAIRRAQRLIQDNGAAYNALMAAMEQRQSVTACCQAVAQMSHPIALETAMGKSK